jgi:hypothetical protein
VLERLCKVADVACDVLISVYRQRDHGLRLVSVSSGYGVLALRIAYYKTEREPRVAFNNVPGIVSAVIASVKINKKSASVTGKISVVVLLFCVPTHDALVAFHLLSERMFAASED